MPTVDELADRLHPGLIEVQPMTARPGWYTAYYSVGKPLPLPETVSKRGEKLGLRVTRIGVNPGRKADVSVIVFEVEGKGKEDGTSEKPV